MAIGNIDKMSMNLGCKFFCTKKTCSKDIMVPNVGTLHEQVALLAQKSGRHVLLEKPISATCHAGGHVSQEMISSNWPFFFLQGILLPSYMCNITRHSKEPYEPTFIKESHLTYCCYPSAATPSLRCV